MRAYARCRRRVAVSALLFFLFHMTSARAAFFFLRFAGRFRSPACQASHGPFLHARSFLVRMHKHAARQEEYYTGMHSSSGSGSSSRSVSAGWGGPEHAEMWRLLTAGYELVMRRANEEAARAGQRQPSTHVDAPAVCRLLELMKEARRLPVRRHKLPSLPLFSSILSFFFLLFNSGLHYEYLPPSATAPPPPPAAADVSDCARVRGGAARVRPQLAPGRGAPRHRIVARVVCACRRAAALQACAGVRPVPCQK